MIARIDGVRVTPLRVMRDARGAIMHMLRRDDAHFERFGEIYFSWVNPGVVKGWHLHRVMTLNYAVPVGSVRLVLYDARERSATCGQIDELVLGADDDTYALVRVPPGIWNGFLGLGATPSLVANCATEPHDPAEIERRPPRWVGIPYQWGDISPDSG
jgi:dTDP-4-dehydrorhamnose 3,5-epimerase